MVPHASFPISAAFLIQMSIAYNHDLVRSADVTNTRRGL